MADGNFKGMTREPEDARNRVQLHEDIRTGRATVNIVPCEKCGGEIWPGDWPWCDGNSGSHER